MGVIENLEMRVTALEQDREEDRKFRVAINQRLDLLTADMVEVKGDVAKLQSDMVEVKRDLADVKVKVAVIPELQAGQIEIREMVATLLARSERSAGRS